MPNKNSIIDDTSSTVYKDQINSFITEFKKYEGNMDSSFEFLKEKMLEIKMNNKGMIDFLDKTKSYESLNEENISYDDEFNHIDKKMNEELIEMTL